MASRCTAGNLLLQYMILKGFLTQRCYTYDSFVETRGTALREHSCQGMLVFSKGPFPIPAAWM